MENLQDLQLGRIQRWSPVVRPMCHNHHHQEVDTTNTTCSVRWNVCTCNKDISHKIPKRISSTSSSADRSTRGVDTNPTLPRRGGSKQNKNNRDNSSKAVSSSSSHNCKPYMELGGSLSATNLMAFSLSLDRSIRNAMPSANHHQHHHHRTSPSRSSWPSSSSSQSSDPHNDIAKAMIDLALSTIAEDGDDDLFNDSMSSMNRHHLRSKQSFVCRRINSNTVIRNPIAAHGA